MDINELSPREIIEERGTVSGVDTYECPVAGCDFTLSAAGPVPDDEPDPVVESIEAHEWSHEPLDEPDEEDRDGDPALIGEPLIDVEEPRRENLAGWDADMRARLADLLLSDSWAALVALGYSHVPALHETGLPVCGQCRELLPVLVHDAAAIERAAIRHQMTVIAAQLTQEGDA